jgi:hypothetical protein
MQAAPESPQPVVVANRPSEQAPATSWWLEDPFGSVVTGILAPTAAVAFLAVVTFVLASAY